MSCPSQRPAAASNRITHLGFVCFANTGECYLRPRWQRSVGLLSADLMTEKLSQESLADLQPLGSRLLELVPFKPGASKTGLKEHFRLPSPQVLVTSWECNSEHWHRLANPGLWGGPGCGCLSVLQVALQCGSDGFTSGEFLGRAWALLLCRAWMLFPVVAFGLEFGNASSHPATAAALGRVCCRGKSLLYCPSAPLLVHLFPL